jgi:hypothetical protein
MTALVRISGDDSEPATAKAHVVDTFSDDCIAGTVIGAPGPGGFIRHGCDVERQIAIDHGALRFQPLIRPGWGRQSISYGPFRRTHGLALAVSITNGHNTSQGSAIPEHIAKRILRWAVGPDADPFFKRFRAWLSGPRKKQTFRRMLWWLLSTKRTYRLPNIDENLAIGWFSSETPVDPRTDGCGLIMHAAEGENGELWARVGEKCLSAFRRIKNLRIDYVVALRERGAIYYASAMQNAHGFASYPTMRPVAIDPFNDTKIMYAGVHQSVLGQIGFRVDTRVHGVHIGEMPEFASRFGTAHAADTLTGIGALVDGIGTDVAWRMLRGEIQRSTRGALGQAKYCLATLHPDRPSGLIHALCMTSDSLATAGLAFRVLDAENFWLLKVSTDHCSLLRVENGITTEVAQDAKHCLICHTEHSIQILDSHQQIGCFLDGHRLFDSWFDDEALQNSTGVGIWFEGESGVWLRDFEAHAREIPFPRSVSFEPHWCRSGFRTVFHDDFVGIAGDLAGRAPRHGEGLWERTVGVGQIDIKAPGGAHVRGTVQRPHPGRTFYTLPWSEPGFADLEAMIIPPGRRRGENHRCRCGLVFWQDNDNYLSFTVYLDDSYKGASVALFPKRHGFEELYDAVWTMVWDQVSWGQPFRLRVAFDGENFLVHVGDEPILQRRMTDLYPNDLPLQITRVGIAVNWEWGNDTGSRFETFTARV